MALSAMPGHVSSADGIARSRPGSPRLFQDVAGEIDCGCTRGDCHLYPLLSLPALDTTAQAGKVTFKLARRMNLHHRLALNQQRSFAASYGAVKLHPKALIHIPHSYRR